MRMEATSIMAGRRFARGSALWIMVALMAACAPNPHSVILKSLQSQLANQYHECVPLGWAPVPIDGTYYPGYSIESSDEGSWLKAMWIGFVATNELKRPDVRATYDVLDELTRAGLVVKRRFPRGYRYHLTVSAMPYYYSSNDFGNNPDHIPYLCYSTIVPDRVVWNQPVRMEPIGTRTAGVFRAAFEWHASERAPWAASAVLRSHSVRLAPARGALVAKFANVDGKWIVENIYSTERRVPRLADASVWQR